MLSHSIYMDNNATTRCDPRVVEAMLPFFAEDYGNAASRHHAYGWDAKAAVDEAREKVALLIRCGPREVVFTSGATESNNLAIKGVLGMLRGQRDHIVTQATEHKAVLDVCRRLEREGVRLTVLPVNGRGLVSVEQVAQAVTERTALVSVMLANSETGVLQPAQAIGRLCKERGVLFHADAAQAVGKIAVNVDDLGVDLLSVSAHKMYGPKGVGALFVRSRGPRVRLEPLIDGGGHERGMRSGTLNVPGIVGLAAACAIADERMPDEAVKLAELRDRLEAGLVTGLEGVTVNGGSADRLPGTTNLSFAWVDGGALMMALPGLAVSSSSACTSADPEPSYVLRAMGVEEELARGSLRFALGRFNRPTDVDFAVREVIHVVKSLRAASPLYEMASRELSPVTKKEDSQ